MPQPHRESPRQDPHTAALVASPAMFCETPLGDITLNGSETQSGLFRLLVAVMRAISVLLLQLCSTQVGRTRKGVWRDDGFGKNMQRFGW